MNTSKYTHFESVVKVLVVDRLGNPTGEERIVNNPPISHLLPGESVVLINWLYDGADKPEVELLAEPVRFDGKVYRGDLGWGSSVKRGYTYGLTRDILRETGLAKFGEDGQRFGRAFMANGLNGAATGKFRVKFVKPGTVLEGIGPVEDGFGYIDRKLAKAVDNQADKIVLGDARDSYHFWQRVEWNDEVRDEALPFIEESLIDLASNGFNTKANKSFELRGKFIAAEPKMAFHPWIANAMARSSAETIARAAMTVNTNSFVRIAVPSTCETITEPGKNIVTRHPIDAWSSMRATEVEPDEAEVTRVKNLEVIQYSLTSITGKSRLFAKGCVGVADLDGVDLVLCADDRKMSVHKSSLVTIEGIFVATQWFEAGSAIGVNAEFGKKMGLDYDGDMLIDTPCQDRPALFQAVSDFPEQPTFKLVKTHTELDKTDTRPEMIVKSMANIVGMATNLCAATFSFANREQVAYRMGYASVEAMDNKLNFWIKCGTDLFKTNIAAEDIEKQMFQFQSRFLNQFGKLPAWCHWPDEWAFRHGLPEFYRAEMGKDKDDPIVRNSVPQTFDGTIAQILRITLDQVRTIFEKPIETLPLKEFVNWAGEVDEGVLCHAADLQYRFNVRSQSVNWEWDVNVASFKAWLDSEIAVWMKSDRIGRKTAAAALWRAAHNVRSTYSGAASVFMAFPDEALEIVAYKPGRETVVTGVVLTGDAVKDDLMGTGEVQEFKEQQGGKVVIRKTLLVNGLNLKFAPDQPVPPTGKFSVALKRRSPKSFFATCTPV